MKKIAAVLVVLFVMAFPTVGFADMDRLLPIREFFEEEGGEVLWCADERAITIRYAGGLAIVPTTHQNAVVNGHPMRLQESVTISAGRAYLGVADFMSLLFAFMETQAITLTLSEEARDIALYDFDFMVNITRENAVWDNIIYRRLGIDFDEYVEYFRDFIEAQTPFRATYLPEHFPVRGGDDPLDMAADYLSHLLWQEFVVPFEGIGHLAPRELTMYRLLLTAYLRAYAQEEYPSDMEQLLALIEVYTHPQAIWFYGEYEVDIYAEESAFPEIPNNVTTEIIEEGKIAYIAIESFMSSLAYDDLVIFPFLQEVEDFEHLIIDIRGNMGGSVAYFNVLLLMRLIQDNVTVPGHQFFTDGREAQNVMRMLYNSMTTAALETEWVELSRMEIMYTADFVYEVGMPYLNPNDKARLTYVFVTEETLFPYRLPEHNRVNFNGKVWLLVDEWSMSASVNAALAVKSTGIGTVVGENTSGITGPMATYVMLPRTGIIWRLDIGHFTDLYGRSLEEFGVTPHIRNREGMDALETVLAIIEE
ncbi:MAG: S41 family peptidase [Defluviitaleaceae bacterium]|nr:S41 family peptidase [Defluviitaleaceae bacterium]